ncbi:DNA-binding response regulator (plasmid) [Azospirillum baldaniorum]|uniref:Two component transcriptional regulatory protein, LuxR family n=1 Tax=Azospirillum baldaniorum TaxID=1064539 RepID=A0A9P1NP02_9PROT|nr:response regulator transcription factor [Azospirillum baldaniorum]AWJ91876.1 DNA-binding response regulator [Azospirillum baldaniorum]TWA54652.1 LuxR family two component transcriptional regulator [Azospirillum baldaniorum]TWA69258.1 LuxR family two component transcriptional regulator [Azospirillum brasilense]CCD00276.1 two component transcriptional regulatory protein, LuxR family [Azospirillum baldaniorum]
MTDRTVSDRSPATMETPFVAIIDDDPSIRESLVSLLRSVGLTALPFASAQDFLQHRWPDAPGCLVLDVRLPGQSGLEFQRELTGAGIHLPVVFITGHGDIPMSVTAMKAGAVEFLAKPFRDQDLIDAVHTGIERDRDRRRAVDALSDLQERFRSLTPREREVMQLVAAGQLNKQIAAELQLSEITVKVHRASVMRKMQARSLPDLVRIADKVTPNGES